MLDASDPEGWENYIKAIEDPDFHLLELAKKAFTINPQHGALQSKCLRYFIEKDKPDLALEAAHNLIKHNQDHAKAVAALDLFNSYAKSANFSDKEAFTELEGLLS